LTSHENPHEDHQDGVFTRHYTAPRFDNDTDENQQQGPIGLVAMIVNEDGLEQHNPQAAPIIRECIDSFESFEHDLRKICPDQLLHVIPAEAPHLCIAVFREHSSIVLPSLGSRNNSSTLGPVHESTVEALRKSLNQTIQTLRPCKIILQLDSLLLTPEGAMIAGFVASDATMMDAYQKLQTATMDTAVSVLGTLESRPKNLIHVTLGRILGFGDEHLVVKEKRMVLPQQQSAIQELVRRYNHEILPQTVRTLRMQKPHMGTFQLQHVSLLRNVVWFCEENIFYQTWDIANHHPTFPETEPNCQ
jgi:hypothetical protein